MSRRRVSFLEHSTTAWRQRRSLVEGFRRRLVERLWCCWACCGLRYWQFWLQSAPPSEASELCLSSVYLKEWAPYVTSLPVSWTSWLYTINCGFSTCQWFLHPFGVFTPHVDGHPPNIDSNRHPFGVSYRHTTYLAIWFSGKASKLLPPEVRF